MGYKLIGPSQITCTIKGWNETVACQIEDCGNLSLANGEVVFKSQSTLFGDIVDVSCDTGYDLNSSNVITCLSNGHWSETPYCKIVYCNDLEQPDNGAMNATNGTTFNSRVRFRCNTDFLLVGSETVVCQSDGKWSGDTPRCVAKSPNGGHCTSSEYCLLEGSVCENSVCVCKTDIFDMISKKCDIMPLLPYGINNTDTQLKTTDNCGPRITFNPGIPVFGKTHKTLYVCSHGIVSFDNAYIGKYPAKKDKILSDLEGQDVLAPFHAPFRLKQSGGIYFRTYDILKSYSNIETDESVKYIDKIIKRLGGIDKFKSKFALIATWHEVKPALNQFDRETTSTFQLVLATDGSHTFTFYIYGHDQINWTTTLSKPRVWIGYSFSSSNVFTHPFAYTSDMFTLLDARKSAPRSKSDVSGIVFKQLYRNENIRQNNAINCINWYNENKDQKRYFDYIASLTPECPCDIRLSRFDPWFWQIGLHRHRQDKSHYCVDMLHRGNFGHFGKSCCYDLKTWLWVYQRPIAGGFQLYHPKIQNEHLKHDHEPKENCCMKSNYCSLYYSLRPTGSCYKISPFRFGVFWGDPHFATLDGLNFTFNGIGEFVLLRVSTENITFDLQARTARTLKKDGNLTDATAFTAFAARDNTNASVHVELNKARNGLIIYANQVDITSQYNAGSKKGLDDLFTYSTPEANLILARRDNALSVLFPTSGISLNISVSVQMLSISTIIPNTLTNVTSGLLGNFDGNPYNDLMMPNGTVINANSSERQIFDYGQTWEIDEKKSMFVYEDGKSHQDYQNNSFTPRFLDEIDVDKRAQAEQDCNGAENIECVFDLVFTENKEVANATRILKTDADLDRNEINETQPTLTGCESINATLGQKVTCPLSFEDGHDIYFIANNANAQINKTLSTVEYTQSNTDPVDIQVAVRNSNGRSSPGIVINVLLCTGCSGHGVCSNVIRDDQQQTQYFKYFECICESPYDGPNCENEKDWCSTNPCSLERECTTISAKEQLSEGKSYICAECPEGYVKDMNDSDIDDCIDVDECSEKTTYCEHICVNTEGSFECSCFTGYRVSAKNTSKCIDINECEEALDNCSHLCVNNPGGFSCQCHDGYKLQDDGSTCVADTATGVCNTSSESKCADTGGCILEAGIEKCFCDRGLELDANGVVCDDIDECAKNVCPQLCTNNHGNFTCSCFTGYYLNGLTNCEACAATRWGENCEKECVCTGRGAQICDPVKGCLCDPGWEGDTCDEDINECDVANICKDPMKECTNSLGSYLCQCMNGFQEINGTCEDINECASPIFHDCMQECNNAFGGYTCGCFEGYVEINETSCADIDECEQGTADCEQNCMNVPGFYNCYCNTGYTLNDDRSSCEKVSDPCLQFQNLNCSHYCNALDVGYACGCRKGFKILPDKETCSDANECTDADLNLCDKVATCRNTYGSFTCECPTGTKLANDKRTCLVCDEFHFGKECSQTCSCLHGVCDKKTGCVCDSGWIGDNCNIDVDECTAGLLRCSAANTRCVNTAGGAVCSCKTGYINISNQCIDVDECKDSAMNKCDQVCVNTNGSYTCKCQHGFTMLEGSCQDIDECSGMNDCDQICDNTIGSYRCSCHEGYALNLTERKSCSPIHVCTEDNSSTCGDNALCMMQDGEIECRCFKGYVKKNDICVDIDECNETPCSHICINTYGSYTCNCQNGYFLKEDKVTCQVCELFKYGTNCEDICTCVRENTDSCDPKTGQCYCKNGWTGDKCDDDVDECTNSDVVCPYNSECFNTPGSFDCKCDIGYLLVASGECKVCDNRHYGENCNSICNCHIENTDSCNHTSGVCTCKKGWTGETCLDDINECDTDSCSDVSHSFCENRNGSYECICRTGFRVFENTCSDINECEEDAFNACEQSCINSIGSFHCGCFKGYYMVNNVCKECSGNTFGENCTEQCNCVTKKSENVEQTCDTVTGKCRCKSNWKGETCSKDVDECEEDTTLCSAKNNTTCVNTHGWYKCDCIKGFKENADGQCVEDSSFSTDIPKVAGVTTFNFSITIHTNSLAGVNMKSANSFDIVRGKVEKSLLGFYSRYTAAVIQIFIVHLK
ncbi:fibrillin-1-like [Ruditapes philippinarum]|uniref:fibrillin-1-like n=1 Tax=Ruditapes philippinarum TaxID=129788 RepID=UPI00295A7C33|nr:fibrillin-1-like [Ruditapes philippinarum]